MLFCNTSGDALPTKPYQANRAIDLRIHVSCSEMLRELQDDNKTHTRETCMYNVMFDTCTKFTWRQIE